MKTAIILFSWIHNFMRKIKIIYNKCNLQQRYKEYFMGTGVATDTLSV